MATKLSDILNKESTGIMFPFSSSTSSTGVAPVSTTQQVYNTSTNGIMTVQGKQYTGPNAIINYGSKEEGYPRNLKQIEKGMLPQFDESKLPKVGEGKVEVGTPTAPVTPPTEEVKTPEPVVDPCPPGYKLVNGVCQQVAQQKPNEPSEKFIPTYDTAPGLTNKQQLNFYANLYENGGVDSNNYYGVNNLITKDGSSLSFNFSNLENLKDDTPGIGFISNLINVNGSSVNMKGQMKFLLENNLATADIDIKKLDPLSNRPEDTILTLNENGQSFIENIDNVNNALYSKDDFGNIKGKGLFNFLGNAYGSGGIGLGPKEMNSLVIDLAANFGSLSSQFLLNTKGSTFNKGGSLYHLNKLGYGKQYDISKFSKTIQEQYAAESIKEFDKSKKERDSKREEQRNQPDDMKNEFNKIVEQAKNENDPKEKIRLLNKASVYSGAGDRAEPTYNKKGEKEKDLPSSYGGTYQGNSSGDGGGSKQAESKGGKDYKGGATATGTTRCFHPDTDVNGKKIKDIKAGDYINDSLVEGMVQFKMNNPYYLIDDIKVSGSHGVLHNNKWIFVADHPESKEVKDITEFVYVPIVKGGTFKINNTTYADYDYHDIVVLGDDEWKKRRGFK